MLIYLRFPRNFSCDLGPTYIFMSQPSPPAPRKRPRQSRSLLLFEAIREACLRILLDEGPERLTTQRIADVAGINIASLYQYFPNKEAVLAEVFEEQVRRYTTSAMTRLAEIDRLSRVSLVDTLAAIVDMEVEQQLLLLRMEPAFYRAYQRSYDIHTRVNALTQSRDNPGWEAWFPRFLERHQAQLRSADTAALARTAMHALSGTLSSIVEREPGQLEQPWVREELLALLLHYLVGDDANPRGENT